MSTSILPPRRPASGPQLVSDTPILDVLEAMQADLERLRDLAPASDSRSTLESYHARLTTALHQARATDVWVSVEEAARLRGAKSTAAITYLCRNNKLVARKRCGAWEIHKDSVLADTRSTPTEKAS